MNQRGPVDWSGAAEGLGRRVPCAALHPAVVAWARVRPRSERWTVALSGGADSVALLLLLWAHFPERRSRLLAMHFNHRLRGAESLSDARFCVRLCRGLGVPLALGRWEGRPKAATEAQARQARFAFFGRVLASRRARVVWLGQQQDDIAETLLMRLARGSGAAGLAAPRPIHDLGSGAGARRIHARPLLTLKKAAIAAALRSVGAPWCEDASNRSRVHLRNRIRAEVVGRWARASGRDALAGAALTRELLEEDDRALEAWVDATGAVERGGLAVARLAGLPRAIARRALHRWLLREPRAGILSRQGFEALLDSVQRGGRARHSLGVHGFAVILRGRLTFQRARQKGSTH